MEPRHVLLGLFVVDAVINLLANIDPKKNVKIIYLTKPLLMPLLISYTIVGSREPNPWIVAALGFGFLGDVFLMLPGEKQKHFLLGLVAFLANQVLYLVAFVRSGGGIQNIPLWLWLLGIPYLVFGSAVYRSLYANLRSLKAPVMVYLMVILSMGIFALFRWTSVKGPPFWLVFCGSILFMVSDSVLAFDKFKREIRQGRVMVMGTYIAAQFLIAQGFMEQMGAAA